MSARKPTFDKQALINQTSLETRLTLRANEHFIVDPIFPCGALHIITGPSGIGKSTWLQQMLFDWSKGLDILGHKSNPCAWVYVSLDRSLSDADRTLRRLGMGDWNCPVYDMKDIIPRSSRGEIDLDPQISMIVDRFPDVKLIVIEGLQGFLPNTARGQSQNKAEQLWAMRLRDKILDRGITIIATTHDAKSNDPSQRKRQAMLGSHALIGAAGTIIHFATPPVSQETPGVVEPEDRIVTVMGHNFPPMYLHYNRIDQGRFVLDAEYKPGVAGVVPTGLELANPSKIEQMDDWLRGYPAGEQLTTKQIQAQAAEFGVNSNSHVFNWITAQVNRCTLLKEGRGIFRKSATYVQ